MDVENGLYLEVLEYFDSSHLPPHLREVSEPICDLAHKLVDEIEYCEQLEIGLQKLLEAKDAFVRAKVLRTQMNGEESKE